MRPSERPRWFTLQLRDEVARTMTRKQYYAARSWLRRTARIMHLQITEIPR